MNAQHKELIETMHIGDKIAEAIAKIIKSRLKIIPSNKY
jgi:hypothetical protein